MKNKLLFIGLLIFFSSCTKDPLSPEIPITVIDTEEEYIDNTPEKVEQTIYNTSIQNHEWNSMVWHGNTPNLPSMVSAYTYIDVNFDGNLDIVGRREPSDDPSRSRLMTVIINDGESLAEDNSYFDYTVKKDYRKITTADLDLDGDLDIVAFNAEDKLPYNNYVGTGGIDVFLFEDDKFVFSEEVHPTSEGFWSFFHGGTLGDVNNDGYVDIIGKVGGMIYLNNGDGTFVDEPFFGVPSKGQDSNGPSISWYSMEAIDVNNDGYLDLLAGSALSDNYLQHLGTEYGFTHTKEIYFGKGEYPYFEDEPYVLESEYTFIGTDDFRKMSLSATLDFSVNDFNNDGLLDILTYSHSEMNATNPWSALELYVNNGDGTFTNRNDMFENNSNILPHPNGNWFKSYDFDNDGDIEIISETTDYGFKLFDKNSSGKFNKSY